MNKLWISFLSTLSTATTSTTIFLNYMTNLLVQTLNGHPTTRPPIWMMRQAGRYLPEYKQMSKDVGGFTNLCLSPQHASEVTLQPLARFEMDAAIIFSDILMIPYALGQSLTFIPNKGPELSPTMSENFTPKHLTTGNIKNTLQPVYDAIRQTRDKLPKEKALIGFTGAPWTLATYMIEGQTSKQFAQTIAYAYTHQTDCEALLAILEEAITTHALAQIDAGCDVIQIFDSWAGSVPTSLLPKFVYEPTTRIVQAIKKQHPTVPVIAFPKGVHVHVLDYIEHVKPHGVGIDYAVSKSWIQHHLPRDIAVQGNLDPRILAYAPQKEILSHVDQIFHHFGDRSFIFNLGHGILPDTPIDNVHAVVNYVRGI